MSHLRYSVSLYLAANNMQLVRVLIATHFAYGALQPVTFELAFLIALLCVADPFLAAETSHPAQGCHWLSSVCWLQQQLRSRPSYHGDMFCGALPTM